MSPGVEQTSYRFPFPCWLGRTPRCLLWNCSVSSSVTFNPALKLSFSVPFSVCQLCLKGLQPLCLAGGTWQASFSLPGFPSVQQARRSCTWPLQAQPSASDMQRLLLTVLAEAGCRVFQICVVFTAVKTLPGLVAD